MIDAGAVAARRRGKSLPPAGVVRVDGVSIGLRFRWIALEQCWRRAASPDLAEHGRKR